MAADAATGLRRIAVPVSPCISAVDGMGWTEPLAIRAGRYVLGVRGNSAAVRSTLAELFADRLVELSDPHEPVARNLSVHLADAQHDHARGLHRLYLGHHLVLRSVDPGRVLAGLEGFIDAHARAFDADAPQLCAAVVVGEQGALVLPNEVRRTCVDRSRRWRDLGYALVDRPWVQLDLARGEVVVPQPSLVEADLDLPDGVAMAPDAPVAPGRHRIVGWSRFGTGDRHAARVLAAARSLVNLGQLDAAAVLPQLRDLLAGLPDLPAAVAAAGVVPR